MRNSKYWDDFETRIEETVNHLKNKTDLPIRRVAVFITDACNFKCKYCNVKQNPKTMSREIFDGIVDKYGKTSIIHITGGEPSIVPWLYDYIKNNKGRFHLNTNAMIEPPYKHVKRLKISLDSCNNDYWNELVGVRNAYKRVIANIKKTSPHTVTSLTYTLTKQNYQDSPEFAEFCGENFPDLYALFFSVYKGDNPQFSMSENDVDNFFENVLPKLKEKLNDESRHLIEETIDEKIRLMQGVRFKQNLDNNLCYLSMSERVFDPDGNEYTCSHLYRDGIFKKSPTKHEKCLYGCNQRLAQFNSEVGERIK